MRLLMFRGGDGRRLGVLQSEREEVIEITQPADMLELIDAGSEGLARVRAAVSGGKGRSHRLRDVELLAPLDAPRGNVIAIGRNYQKHAEETAIIEGREPGPPTIFTKAITSLTEPYAEIAMDPQASDKIDWEVELAAVIEWASKGMTLPAGAIIATGTPDGVGFARKPPEFLKPGDVMETEVERIGLLRNRIVSAVDE